MSCRSLRARSLTINELSPFEGGLHRTPSVYVTSKSPFGMSGNSLRFSTVTGGQWFVVINITGPSLETRPETPSMTKRVSGS